MQCRSRRSSTVVAWRKIKATLETHDDREESEHSTIEVYLLLRGFWQRLVERGDRREADEMGQEIRAAGDHSADLTGVHARQNLWTLTFVSAALAVVPANTKTLLDFISTSLIRTRESAPAERRLRSFQPRISMPCMQYQHPGLMKKTTAM
jgi:hypothetical protein